VGHYLPYFRQQLITRPLLALLPFQSLFTESSHRDQLLALSPFSGALRAPCPLCCMSFLVLCLLFIFFCELSLPKGLCWFIPSVAVVILHTTYLLTYWSASPKQAWSRHLVAQNPSCFLSVMCSGEALYRLGVQGVTVLILLCGFFLPSVAPASRHNF
jgi:hypothetical protein